MKRSHQQHSARGFTLAEVLVATAIFVIILVAALMIYDRSNRVFKQSMESADVQQNTRIGFENLMRDVRMAGFDYDRDGFPSRASEYQQPDEQIEYAGRAAIVFRANTDYNIDIAREHGRECGTPRPNCTGLATENYEPAGGQFPIVTISNREIIAYALRRSNVAVTDNPDSITFTADMARPRAAYPGGSPESTVTIPNVDLTNSSPPYTLYRFSFTAGGAVEAVPVAENIRSLRFRYFRDITGTELVYRTAANDIPYGAVGGAGLYNPNVANPAAAPNFADRDLRGAIRSVEVELVGMNANAERGYVSPVETALPDAEEVAAARQFRQYALRSLLVPRNLGIRGIVESDPNPPGKPTITSICTGHCGIALVTWDPPVAGTVDSYIVRHGTAPGGNYTTVGASNVLSNSAAIGGLSPGNIYYFEVVAVNVNGQTASDDAVGPRITNRTKPEPPVDLTATREADGNAEANRIRLTWTTPTNNNPSNATLGCNPASSPAADKIHDLENIRYRIWRGTSANFNPTAGQGVVILDSTSLTQPTAAPGSPLFFLDSGTTSLPAAGAPASCTPYYYRIQAYDKECSTAAAYNTPTDITVSFSTIHPPVSDPAIPGDAASTAVPAAPSALTVAPSPDTKCTPGLNRCDVTLNWPKVTATNPPSTPITVDKYKLRRYQRKEGDPWPVTPDAIIDITGIAAMPGTNGTYTDAGIAFRDPSDKKRWQYRYLLTAIHCGQESLDSPEAIFPVTCVSLTPSSSTSGDGSGAAPFLATAGDSITITPSAPVVSVRFEVFPEPNDPAAPPVFDATLSTAPYTISWPGGDDGQLYRIVVTADQGTCSEVAEVYVLDQPASCPNATTAASAPGAGISGDPWILSGGDRVVVDVAAPAVISEVRFQLLTSGGAPVGSSFIDNSAPFQYVYSDQNDNTLYQLRIDVNYTDGCVENLVKIVRDAVCSGASVTPAGQTSGTGSSGSPWVMNANDTVTYGPPSGTTILSVSSVLTPFSPSGSALAPVVDNTSPFVYTWVDRTDNNVYQLDSTITYASGCSETVTSFIRDEQPSCSLTVDNPDGTILTKPATRQLALRVINTVAAALTLESIEITWTNPDPSKLRWDNMAFPSGAVYTQNTTASGLVNFILNPKPAALAASDVVVPGNNTLALTLNYSRLSGNPDLTTAAITKICVRYRRADTGSFIYSCRILNSVAPDASTNNPTTCD